MENIQLKKENVLNAYKNASDEQKELLEQLFGSEIFKPADIRDRIKTFADAAIAVGIEDPEEWENGYSNVEPDILAYFKLRIITKALNEGWEPQFVEGERRWFPYFHKTKARVVARSNNYAYAYGGVSYAVAYYDSAYVSAYDGSRLVFKSEELAKYAGQQFIDIYADFCFIPKERE